MSPREKRRRSDRLSLDPYWLILALVVIVAGTLLTVSLWFPKVAVASNVLGSIVGTAGTVWLIVVAFSDDTTEGMLCLLFPCYTVVYFMKNFDETKRAFLLQLTGGAISTAAMLLQLRN